MPEYKPRSVQFVETHERGECLEAKLPNGQVLLFQVNPVDDSDDCIRDIIERETEIIIRLHERTVVLKNVDPTSLQRVMHRWDDILLQDRLNYKEQVLGSRSSNHTILSISKSTPANPYFVCDTPVSMNKTDKMLRKMELFASKQDDEEFWDAHHWDNEDMHRQSDKIMKRLLILSPQE